MKLVKIRLTNNQHLCENNLFEKLEDSTFTIDKTQTFSFFNNVKDISYLLKEHENTLLINKIFIIYKLMQKYILYKKIPLVIFYID